MVTDKRKRVLTIVVHAGAWLFLLLLQQFFNSQFNRDGQTILLPLILLLLIASIFYINYFKLVPALYFKKKYTSFLGVNLLVLATALTLLYTIETRLLTNGFRRPDTPQNEDRREGPPRRPPLEIVIYRNSLILLVTVGAAITVRISGKWIEEENKRKLAETEHLKSEMTLLRMQLQPHFFFNTLNNIYALIGSHPTQAKDVVHKLSKLMRHVLYKADVPLISLQEEVQFLQAYIDVSKVRFGPHVNIDTTWPNPDEVGLIPPLLFISLIENAFKHGVDANKPSFIKVHLQLSKNTLHVKVSNSYFTAKQEHTGDSGIGLTNFKKRLGLLYTAQEFNFQSFCKHNVYHAELLIFKLHE